MAVLTQEKRKRKFVDENENLWVYVAGVWWNFINFNVDQLKCYAILLFAFLYKIKNRI